MFYSRVFLFCLLCLQLSAPTAFAEVGQKPLNILFIMSDDHSATAIGAYGSRLAGVNPTPALDKLASEGTLFKNTFVTNSICTPSRVSILTGQYSHINGALSLGAKLPAHQQYLPLELKKLGYQTAIVGKWHISSEPAGFDDYEVLYSQGDYQNPTLFTKHVAPWPNNGKQYTGHSSDVITDRAINWLKQRRDASKPFFLMHHFKAPHAPYSHASRYDDYLTDIHIPEPESLLQDGNWGSIATKGKDNSLRQYIGSSVSQRHPRNVEKSIKFKSKLTGDERTQASYQGFVKRYLRAVKGVDDNIQRILDYLAQSGLAENTLVVYTSDQGYMLGEHDFIDKRWMYEESLRMPLIIKHPRLNKVKVVDSLVNNTDFAPTLLSLAGAVQTPNYMQGYDLSDLLAGGTPKQTRTASYYRYWSHMNHHYNPAHFGLRTERYKLIFYYGKHYSKDPVKDAKRVVKKKNKGKKKRPPRIPLKYMYQTPAAWEFYDLAADPHEMNNLYGDSRYQGVIKGLKAKLKHERTVLGEKDGEHYPHIQTVIDTHWDD